MQVASNAFHNRPICAFPHSNCPCDGTRDIGSGSDGCETNATDAVREHWSNGLSDHERETGFPYPPGARQRQQAHVGAMQEREHCRNLGLTPEQGRWRDG